MFTNEECVICLDMLNDRDCCRLECGHHLHKDCLENYMDYNNNLEDNTIHCPTCQHPITKVYHDNVLKVPRIVSGVCCVLVSILVMSNMVNLLTTYWI
jgi:hypothetical protein